MQSPILSSAMTSEPSCSPLSSIDSHELKRCSQAVPSFGAQMHFGLSRAPPNAIFATCNRFAASERDAPDKAAACGVMASDGIEAKVPSTRIEPDLDGAVDIAD